MVGRSSTDGGRMEASSEGSTQPRRGEVGRQTYEMVQRRIGEGKKATEAFAEVAEQTGRSAATVATAYYRTARSMPGGGGVKQRPRRGRPRGSTTTRARARGAQTTQALILDLV